MAEFVSSCPHCCTEKVGFIGYGENRVLRGAATQYWNTLFVCRKCEQGIVVVFFPNPIETNPLAYHGDPRDHGFRLITIFPAPHRIEAPNAVPEDIASDYREAEDNLVRENFNSAGMMFRRVLDIATQRLAPSQKVKKLYERIEWLANQHKITEELKELAHFIRDDGNTANHEDKKFTEDDARQMKKFTYLFLMYTFTLSQLVEDARTKDEPAN